MNKLNLSEEEIIIYNIMKSETELSRAELDKKSGFYKSKTLRIIDNLIDKNIIKKLGEGPGTTYRLR
jgi:ATP-dependent DNA helicase RecG